jgi:redox-sensitive bicupin YhaK (pirin superfamily)
MPTTRGLPPSVEQHQFTEADRQDTLLQIVHPKGAAGSGVMVHQDVHMYASRLSPGVTLEHQFREGRGGYFYLIDGEIELNEERLRTGDAAKVLGDGLLRVRADQPSELILVDTPL